MVLTLFVLGGWFGNWHAWKEVSRRSWVVAISPLGGFLDNLSTGIIFIFYSNRREVTLDRYERDVNRANRSAIKKILERDEAASRYTILCVAAIKHYGSDDFPGSFIHFNFLYFALTHLICRSPQNE